MMDHLFDRILKESDFDCSILNETESSQFCEQTKFCVQLINTELNRTKFWQLCELIFKPDSQPDVVIKPETAEVWMYGILCVSIISLTSVLGVAVVPLMSKLFYSRLLSVLIGLAVGSLSGSAIFHLIPAAFSLAEVGLYAHHSYLNISLMIGLGMYAFFIIERAMKIFLDAKGRGKQGHSHSHSQSVATSQSQHYNQDIKSGDCSALHNGMRPLLSPTSAETRCEGIQQDMGESDSNNRQFYEESKPAIRASFGHVEKPHPQTRPTVDEVACLAPPENRIQTVAWMIIFGDGIHNFIDGLSIGAAFSESILTGVSVSVAVLCEEFPHELGDFAVLLNAGMRSREALLYNFLSACTCYLGLILGILLGELDGNIYIFGLAGGMFLYISLVDMVPEMNESVETASRLGTAEAIRVFMLQNVGILVGIASLYTLARYQDEIDFGKYG